MVSMLIIMALFISWFFMILATNMAMVTTHNSEKLSPFECGFNPLYKNRLPFSLQFFLIALIFIIFDIEIILLIPAPMTLFISYNVTTSVLILVLILITGLMHEWHQGSLNWA